MARGLVLTFVALGLVTCGDPVALPHATGTTAPSPEDQLAADQEARLRNEQELRPQDDARAKGGAAPAGP